MPAPRPSPTKEVASSERLPRTVIIVGLVSMLNDFASEMVVPLIPLLLATVLGAGPAALGAIEGGADAVSNLVKLWAGRNSDMLGRRRKPFVVLGYLVSNIFRPLIGTSASWITVLGIRISDRIGKGLRTAPRDAMIADAAVNTGAGRAFGFARALDHAGAVLGALTAAAVVHWGTHNLEAVIALSAVPGSLAVALIALGIKEPPAVEQRAATPAPLRWHALHKDARGFLVAVALFSLGRIPETFLLLRGHELGLGTVPLLILWAALHAFKSLLSNLAGKMADRYGRHPLILAGWGLYVAALVWLALSDSPALLVAGAFILAAHFGLSEGAERALIRDVASAEERGTAFGWYHMLTGLAAILAGLTLGWLWVLYAAKTAFLASALLGGVGTMVFWWNSRSRIGRTNAS